MDRHHAAKTVALAGNRVSLKAGEIAEIRIDGFDRNHFGGDGTGEA